MKGYKTYLTEKFNAPHPPMGGEIVGNVGSDDLGIDYEVLGNILGVGGENEFIKTYPKFEINFEFAEDDDGYFPFADKIYLIDTKGSKIDLREILESLRPEEFKAVANGEDLEKWFNSIDDVVKYHVIKTQEYRNEI